jgi:tripartite-type tricarboxylate transporter receptor subunit TctC
VTAALAQQYPTQPVRIVVGFGPGSGADVVARLVGREIESKIGQPVVVENKPGNGSMLAAEFVGRASADGYTLFMGTVAQTLVPIRKKMAFKLDKSMAPVTLLGNVPSLFVANPSLGVKDVKELLALAKTKPDSLTFGTSGSGTASHLAAELFNLSAGVKIVVVHYQGGSSQAMIDLLGGRINLMFNVAATLAPHVEKGDLVALGVAQPTRTKLLPSVPTMAEQGLPGFDAGVWIGLLAPIGTPRDVVDRLSVVANGALRTDTVRKVLEVQGIDPIGTSPDEFVAFIRQDIEKWEKAVGAAGLFE